MFRIAIATLRILRDNNEARFVSFYLNEAAEGEWAHVVVYEGEVIAIVQQNDPRDVYATFQTRNRVCGEQLRFIMRCAELGSVFFAAGGGKPSSLAPNDIAAAWDPKMGWWDGDEPCEGDLD